MEGHMRIRIPKTILKQIHTHGEASYPHEGAGLMLGKDQAGQRVVTDLLELENAREETARHNRYLLTAEDMLRGEKEADRLGLDIVGIFHSHPDHPNRPSEFDREWAIPWYSYLITSVVEGKAAGSRSWRLREDRSRFIEESLEVTENP